MELADGLKSCMVAALKAWKERNEEELPEKIIFFRDGVGDGQLEAVAKHELGQIMAAFKVGGPFLGMSYSLIVSPTIH